MGGNQVKPCEETGGENRLRGRSQGLTAGKEEERRPDPTSKTYNRALKLYVFADQFLFFSIVILMNFPH